MKKLFEHFFAQRYARGLLVLDALVTIVWTYAWSKQDGEFNYDMILIGVGFLVFILFCTWLSLKVEAWRTGRRR